MSEKGIPTIPLMIAGKEYSLRFDVQAQIQATQSLKLIGMGMASKNWWALLNPPYDVSELVAMIQAGINGGSASMARKSSSIWKRPKRCYRIISIISTSRQQNWTMSARP
ncbi:hypothetical protein M0R72_21080 [Candidatus Pacearchaeota archaeon]|jgi:hypothetical protein|nr:hypothetical protein [Candidatus Pacearchaeota archaeon]